MTVVHVVTGPEPHGVVRFGRSLDDALHANGFHTDLARHPSPPSGAGVHVQFTDRLFGTTAGAAAAAFARLAADARARGARTTVTLHDVPQPSDGAHHAARAAAYRQVCTAADGIAVNSEHERLLLADIGVDVATVHVVPLPIDTIDTIDTIDATGDAGRRPVGAAPATVGIFGWVYPGKGHAEVLHAMSALPSDVGLAVVGEASDGHADVVAALVAHAQRDGRPIEVTGHVPDHAVTARLRAVTVPVAHHRHVSASGSLNSWLAAGRRPLAPATRYSRELADRNPDALLLYPDTADGLRTALAAALADPDSTWLPPGTRCVPTADEAALAYARLLARWHA